MEELCSKLEIIKNVQEEGVCLEGGKIKGPKMVNVFQPSNTEVVDSTASMGEGKMRSPGRAVDPGEYSPGL